MKRIDRKRIEAFEDVDIAQVARALKTSYSTVWQYKSGFRKASPERALKIDALTGGVVSKEVLRPDIWSPTQ